MYAIFNYLKSISFSMFRNEGRVDIIDLINGILGSLVSVTAGCFLYHAWEAILIGFIGACLACLTMPLFDKLGVDDPVGASSVHGVCGAWGCYNSLYKVKKNLKPVIIFQE
jgi:ammonium transporter, Amt family